MERFLKCFLLLTIATSCCAVDWTASPFNPPAVPLAVRSPYLSAWLPQGQNAPSLGSDWPTFWTGRIVGWAGFVRVDGKAYCFLGSPGVPNVNFAIATQKSLTWTSTQSQFIMTAGPVDFTVTFLSPVEPTDFVKQSLPLSYLSINATSTDGLDHSIQIYTDITGEWITGDNSLVANWTTTVDDIITHQVQLEEQTVFGEVDNRIQQGAAYYSLTKGDGTSYQTGEDILVRAQFINSGSLQNTQDTKFRAVEDEWPVFAFAVDLGSSKGTTAPIVFSVGHFRDPVVGYIVENDQIQNRHLYYLTQFSSVSDAISFFMGDYMNALISANVFDEKVQNDASKFSEAYADIVALSIRQSLASMEITVSQNADGSFNSSDVLVFMKEISSDGNVNTVDVIFPTWPLFLYLNPTLGRYLLEPLFRYQATGQWPSNVSIHDLGTSYPMASGHNNGSDEMMPVEECGNMLIMSLSYSQTTGDNSLIEAYRNLLDQWTQFLIDDSLIPANQLSTDDFSGPLANQTNLAIKGIIGIKAMSVISELLGDSASQSKYSSIAESYVSEFQTLATAPTKNHLTLNYGNDTSWSLTYNLYGDKLLNLNLFPQSLYDLQTAWYKNVNNYFGIPLDTRHTYTLSNWEIWTAAIVSDADARNLFINAVRAYLADGQNDSPMGDWFDTTSGKVEVFRARPVVGGHLALLAMPDILSGTGSQSGSATAPSSTSSSKHSYAGVNDPPIGLLVLGICLAVGALAGLQKGLVA